MTNTMNLKRGMTVQTIALVGYYNLQLTGRVTRVYTEEGVAMVNVKTSASTMALRLDMIATVL